MTLTLASVGARADGFFVARKFIWDKQLDINEPTQKAIIVHDAGREELILQVKYGGPVGEFGWLIPVPDLPMVRKGSMECFYELSKYTQENLEPDARTGLATMGIKGGGAPEETEPPVKIIEVKTVGAYDITTLSTRDAGALGDWLKTNEFILPTNSTEVIDFYVKQHWYFVAVKINLKERGLSSAVPEELANGELHPLQIGFASERCVFPLKISSLNNTPSEVQIYVLSREPLVEKTTFQQKLSEHGVWRTNMIAKLRQSMSDLRNLRTISVNQGARPIKMPPMISAEDNSLSEMSHVNSGELLICGEVMAADLAVCSREILALNQYTSWWLTKFRRTFRPEEMRDLRFEPAVSVFTTALADSEGAFAAANLMRLGTNGTAALIAAMQNENPAVRAHAASIAPEMYTLRKSEKKAAAPKAGLSLLFGSDLPLAGALDAASRPAVGEIYEPDSSSTEQRVEVNPALVKLLPTLLNDREPHVRLHAIETAMNCPDPKFSDRMVELLRDEYAEVSVAAASYLAQQRGESSKYTPVFRQMLKDTNANVQMAGFRVLTRSGIQLPREELLALFSVPRMEVAGAAFALLGRDTVSCEEARPLLKNSLWSVRLVGLGVLTRSANTESIELAIPLLKDPEEVVRYRAYDLIKDLTGWNFPVERPEQWEKWWQENKATFKATVSPEEFQQKRLERLRQMRSREERSEN